MACFRKERKINRTENLRKGKERRENIKSTELSFKEFLEKKRKEDDEKPDAS